MINQEHKTISTSSSLTLSSEGGAPRATARRRVSTVMRWGSASLALVWGLFAGCNFADPSELDGTASRDEPVARSSQALSYGGTSYVSFSGADGDFPLATGGQVAPWIVSDTDFPGVLRVAEHLQADVAQVTGVEPTLSSDAPSGANVVIAGTLGRGGPVDQLVQDGKLDVSDVEGRWDTFVIEVVEAPLAGVDRALVIAGSNRRGTVYGMYDLAAQIGVSPWSWWADVPVEQHPELFVAAGRYRQEPAVKYRGIFINDENPSLLNWYNQTYGGDGRFGHEFYERVFELVMRMKGNYLWAAQWGKSFADDDPENPRLADEYGIVLGTTHHEPMMRTQDEWERYGSGEFDFVGNRNAVTSFWREGIQRMGSYESIVTVGMRGLGDEPGGLSQQELAEVITEQRSIISDVTGQPAESVTQLWAMYKEVQVYYEDGYRPPEDILLLFADDNWGNIRRLPDSSDLSRPGGSGVYYHYDYVGGPRSYKWLNTNQIERVWEQMDMAYRYGADGLWLVNVGDLKPMEFPIEFFLDLAWNPDDWPAERLPEYTYRWARRQFGSEHALEIADILAKYTKYNARRKPELLSPSIYSLTSFREAERVVEDYNALTERAEAIYAALPEEYRDAFYQLVLYPTAACANLNDLYVSAARNQLYAQQGRASANEWADRVDALFTNDQTLTERYHSIANGKWDGMMSQTHIGWDDWNEPASNVKPSVMRINVPAAASLGVAIDGSTSVWPDGGGQAVLPEFTPYRAEPTQYVDVFNRGQTAFDFTAEADVAWLTVTPSEGTVQTEQRLTFQIDWAQVPEGEQQASVTISGASGSVVVQAPVRKPASPTAEELEGFAEANGYVSIEAEHYTNAVDGNGINWRRVPNLGKTLSSMIVSPSDAPSVTAGGDSPHLEYKMQLVSSGQVTVRAYLSPSLQFQGQTLRYAVSFDDGSPQMVGFNQDTSEPVWEGRVRDNINIGSSTHTISAPGEHVLKFWMVDAGVVLQKLVVETGNVPASYLGPPESAYGAGVNEPPPFDPGTVNEGGAGGSGTPDGNGGEGPGAGGSNSGIAGSGGTGNGPGPAGNGAQPGVPGPGPSGGAGPGPGAAGAPNGPFPVGSGPDPSPNGPPGSPSGGVSPGGPSPTVAGPGAGPSAMPSASSAVGSNVEDSGCACRTLGGASSSRSGFAWFAAAALFMSARRRRLRGRRVDENR